MPFVKMNLPFFAPVLQSLISLQFLISLVVVVAVAVVVVAAVVVVEVEVEVVGRNFWKAVTWSCSPWISAACVVCDDVCAACNDVYESCSVAN